MKELLKAKDVHYIPPEDPNRVACNAGKITSLWASTFIAHVTCTECLRRAPQGG